MILITETWHTPVDTLVTLHEDGCTPLINLPPNGFELSHKERGLVVDCLRIAATALDESIAEIQAQGHHVSALSIPRAVRAAELREHADRIADSEYILVGPGGQQ